MLMEPYKNFGENAGVRAFEILKNGIIIQFNDDKGFYYHYDNAKPGKLHVKQMKILALQGKGLTTYINQNVRGNYADKSDSPLNR